jgi:hypothetical protein
LIKSILSCRCRADNITAGVSPEPPVIYIVGKKNPQQFAAVAVHAPVIGPQRPDLRHALTHNGPTCAPARKILNEEHSIPPQPKSTARPCRSVAMKAHALVISPGETKSQRCIARCGRSEAMVGGRHAPSDGQRQRRRNPGPARYPACPQQPPNPALRSRTAAARGDHPSHRPFAQPPIL